NHANQAGQTNQANSLAENAPPPGSGLLSRNEPALTILVRNAMFKLVLAAAYDRLDTLVAESNPPLPADTASATATAAARAGKPRGMTRHDWDEALDDYFDEYDDIEIDGDARNPQLLRITKQPGQWLLMQTVLDPQGDKSWAIRAILDLDLTDELGEPALTVTDFAPLEKLPV
ncbi:MAG: DUF3516 domain-containing protein, partial [Microbacteriaceae bacterium]|nr:DUF3516 domain-containing protein [Microbacteriaceae bacterium]